MNGQRRRLVLNRAGHRFVFTWFEGHEAGLLAVLVDMASDPNCAFDWFDAAVLSYQMGRCVHRPQPAGAAGV
jgi:hypothetical protein